MKPFLLLAVVLWLTGCGAATPPPELTWQQALQQSAQHFKTHYIAPSGQVPSQTFGGAISEGQSYAMLIALRTNDPATFERVWRWTDQHLRLANSPLFGWHRKADGTLEPYVASDADQDIADALLLAAQRWQRPDYHQAALPIIQALWQANVRRIQGHYYWLPGTWPPFEQPGLTTLNPSYFAPSVYRRFAQADPAHPWAQLAEDVTETLSACSQLTPHHLPPNWCGVTPAGRIVFSDVQGPQARHFGYDAFRVFWRMAEAARDGDAKAMAYLKRTRHLLNTPPPLPEGFDEQGRPVHPGPSGFTHAAVVAQAAALGQAPQALFTRYLAPLFKNGAWHPNDNYYLQAVIWLNLSTLCPDLTCSTNNLPPG